MLQHLTLLIVWTPSTIDCCTQWVWTTTITLWEHLQQKNQFNVYGTNSPITLRASPLQFKSLKGELWWLREQQKMWPRWHSQTCVMAQRAALIIWRLHKTFSLLSYVGFLSYLWNAEINSVASSFWSISSTITIEKLWLRHRKIWTISSRGQNWNLNMMKSSLSKDAYRDSKRCKQENTKRKASHRKKLDIHN